MARVSKTSGPLVVLSGPTGGLGRALLDLLLDIECSLILLGRGLQSLQVRNHLRASSVELIELDFSGGERRLSTAVRKLRKSSARADGRPLVLISNVATIEPIGRGVDLTSRSLEKSFKTNLMTPIVIANTLARVVSRGSGSLFIINIDTGASTKPIKGWQAYCSSKAAYRMSLDVLALENSSITVRHYDPGTMNTRMQATIRKQSEADMPDVEYFRSLESEGRLSDPRAVAHEIVRHIENLIQ